jgi:WD40 repeat protein
MVVQLGHSGFVFAVAFSPDNRFVLSGGGDGKARLWDAITGAEIRRFQGHTANVSSVAFSPDGQRVLTGSKDDLNSTDHSARLWDINTGREIQRFEGHRDGITSVAFSHDGRMVLTGSGNELRDGNDFTARLWDVSTGKQLQIFEGHRRDVMAVAFSPDDNYVLTGSNDSRAILWNRVSGKPVRQFVGHTGFVNSVAFSKNGRFVLTASAAHAGESDNTARLWSVTSGKEIRQFVGHEDGILSAALSPDGFFVVTGSADHTARLWNASTGKQLVKYVGHTDIVRSVAFSSDGNSVLTGGDDMTARLWNTRTGQQSKLFTGHSSVLSSAAFSPNGQLIATGDWTQAAHLWNLVTGREMLRYQGQSGHIEAIAFSPDGSSVLTGYDKNAATLFDTATGEIKWQLPTHASDVGYVAFSRDGRFILTRDDVYIEEKQESHGILRLWDVNAKKEIKRFGDHVHSFSFSSDGRLILVGGYRGMVQLYETTTGKEIKSFIGHAAPVNSVAFSSDDSLILSGSGDFHDKDYSARLWDAKTGIEIRKFEGHTLDVNSVAFSPDDQLALTGSADKTAILWDVKTGKEVRRFMGHIDGITAALFSPDGRLVLTVSEDQTARLWRTSTGKEICRLISFRDGTWVVVTPDGRFDTNNLERIEGLHWVMPDDPLAALPVEIFMRPYYQPRLLPRLLADDDFGKKPSLAELNRVQPKVTITDVKKEGDGGVTVTVEVENVQHTYPREENPVVESGAKDLRLFRDGQLVSYRDGNLLDQEQRAATGCERVAGSVKKCRAVFEHIRLSQQEGVKDVEFSAYAFNTSDVKSETFRYPFPYTPELPTRRGRVYLVTVGVSKYENPAWDLEFAANDAHLVDETVGAKLCATGEYDDVVNVTLTAEEKVVNGQKLLVRNATKENFRKVMQLLAGDKLPESEIREIPNARKIEKATPDDVVMIFFSSHGYRDTERFYLFPYNTGAGEGRDPEAVVPRSISSEDLYRWLRDIDAGDMVLVIDACHSAAVTGKDFKPGPMGSRGMGQLAYDKGMRILAATQPDTTAAEVDDLNQNRKIQHGLLTYALVQEGLINRQADSNGDKLILLSEWLQYGVTDVPKLYEEAIKSQTADATPTTVIKRGTNQVRFTSKGEGDASTQQPSLFDFTQKVRRQRRLAVDRIWPAVR